MFRFQTCTPSTPVSPFPLRNVQQFSRLHWLRALPRLSLKGTGKHWNCQHALRNYTKLKWLYGRYVNALSCPLLIMNFDKCSLLMKARFLLTMILFKSIFKGASGLMVWELLNCEIGFSRVLFKELRLSPWEFDNNFSFCWRSNIIGNLEAVPILFYDIT